MPMLGYIVFSCFFQVARCQKPDVVAEWGSRGVMANQPKLADHALSTNEFQQLADFSVMFEFQPYSGGRHNLGNEQTGSVLKLRPDYALFVPNQRASYLIVNKMRS